MTETLSLGPTETAAGRPFTDVDLIEADMRILHGMLDDLLAHISTTTEVVPHERVSWKDEGLVRRLLVCNEDKLRSHPDACLVGFFGERRTELDMEPLEEANAAIVAQFKSYPGILSYSSVELPNGYWANMVLHDDPVDREYWNRGALHAQAARTLSPIHYRNVRIHNARLTGKIEESPDIKLMRTKYWDYEGKAEWAAVRELAPAGPHPVH